MAFARGRAPDPFQIISELQDALEELTGESEYSITPVGEHGQFSGYTRLAVSGPGFTSPEQSLFFDVAYGGPTPSPARMQGGQLKSAGYSYQVRTRSGAAYHVGDIVQAPGPESLRYEQAPTHLARAIHASFEAAHYEQNNIPGKEDVNPTKHFYEVLTKGSREHGVPGGTLLSRLSASAGQRLQFGANVSVNWGNFSDFQTEVATKEALRTELERGNNFGQWLVGWALRKGDNEGDRLLLERLSHTGRERQGAAGPIRQFEAYRGQGGGNIKHLTTYMASGELAVPLEPKMATDFLTGESRLVPSPMQPKSIESINRPGAEGAWQVPVYAQMRLKRGGEDEPRAVLAAQGLVTAMPIHSGAAIVDPARFSNIYAFGERGRRISELPEGVTVHDLLKPGAFFFGSQEAPRSLAGQTIYGGRERQQQLGGLLVQNAEGKEVLHKITGDNRAYDFSIQGATLELPPFYNPVTGAFSPVERSGFMRVGDVRQGAERSVLEELQDNLWSSGIDVTDTGREHPFLALEGYGLTAVSGKRGLGSKYGLTTSGSDRPLMANLGALGDQRLGIITQDIKQISEAMAGSFGLQPYENQIAMLEKIRPGFGQAAQQAYPNQTDIFDEEVLASTLSNLTGREYSPQAMFQAMYYRFAQASPEENLQNLRQFNTGYLPEDQYINFGRVGADERQAMLNMIETIKAEGGGGKGTIDERIADYMGAVSRSSAAGLLSESEVRSVAAMMASNPNKSPDEMIRFEDAGNGMYDMSGWVTGKSAMYMPTAIPLTPEYQGRFKANTELMFAVAAKYPEIAKRMGMSPSQGPLGKPPGMLGEIDAARQGWIESAEAWALDLDARRGHTIESTKGLNVVDKAAAAHLQQILPAGFESMPEEKALGELEKGLEEVFGYSVEDKTPLERQARISAARQGNYAFAGMGAVLGRPESIRKLDKFSNEANPGERESVAHFGTLYLAAWRRMLDAATAKEDENGQGIEKADRYDMALRAMSRYREVMGKAFEGKGVVGQLFGRQYSAAMGGRYQVLSGLGPNDVYLPETEMRRLADMAGIGQKQYGEFKQWAKEKGSLPGLFARYPTVSRKFGTMPVRILTEDTLPEGVRAPVSTRLGDLQSPVYRNEQGKLSVRSPFARGQAYISSQLGEYFVGDEDDDPYALLGLFGRRATFNESGTETGSEFVDLAEGPGGEQFHQDLRATGGAMDALKEMFGRRGAEFSVLHKTVQEFLQGKSPTQTASELSMQPIEKLISRAEEWQGGKIAMGRAYNVRRRMESAAASIGMSGEGFAKFFEQSAITYQEPLDFLRTVANPLESMLGSARVTRKMVPNSKGKDEEVFKLGANLSGKGGLEWKNFGSSRSDSDLNVNIGTQLRALAGMKDSKKGYAFTNEALAWMFAPNKEAEAENLRILEQSGMEGEYRHTALLKAGALGQSVSDLSPMGTAFMASTIMNTRRKMEIEGDSMNVPGVWGNAKVPFAGKLRSLSEIERMPEIANTITAYKALTKDEMPSAERIMEVQQSLPDDSPLKQLFSGIAEEWGLINGKIRERDFPGVEALAEGAVRGVQQELVDRGPASLHVSTIANAYAAQQGHAGAYFEDVMLSTTANFLGRVFRGTGAHGALLKRDTFRKTANIQAGIDLEDELMREGKVKGLHIGQTPYPLSVRVGNQMVVGTPDVLEVRRSPDSNEPTLVTKDIKLSEPNLSRDPKANLVHHAQVAGYNLLFQEALRQEDATGEGGILMEDPDAPGGQRRITLRELFGKWSKNSNMPGFDVEGAIEAVRAERMGSEMVYGSSARVVPFDWKETYQGGMGGLRGAIDWTVSNIKDRLLPRTRSLEAMTGMSRLSPEVEQALRQEPALSNELENILGVPSTVPVTQPGGAGGGSRKPPRGGAKSTAASSTNPSQGTPGPSTPGGLGSTGGTIPPSGPSGGTTTTPPDGGLPPNITVEAKLAFAEGYKTPQELERDVWSAQLTMRNYQSRMPDYRQQVQDELQQVAERMYGGDPGAVQQLMGKPLHEAYDELAGLAGGSAEIDQRLTRLKKPLTELGRSYTMINKAARALRNPEFQPTREELEGKIDNLTDFLRGGPDALMLQELGTIGVSLSKNLGTPNVSSLLASELETFEAGVSAPGGPVAQIEQVSGMNLWEMAYSGVGRTLSPDVFKQIGGLIRGEHAKQFGLARGYATRGAGALPLGSNTQAMALLAKEMGISSVSPAKAGADRVGKLDAETIEAFESNLASEIRDAGIVPGDIKQKIGLGSPAAFSEVRTLLESNPQLVANLKAFGRVRKDAPGVEVSEQVSTMMEAVRITGAKAGTSPTGEPTAPKLSFTAEKAEEMLAGPRDAMFKVRETAEALAKAQEELTHNYKGAGEKVVQAEKAHEEAVKQFKIADLQVARAITQAELGQLKSKQGGFSPSELKRLQGLEAQEISYSAEMQELMKPTKEKPRDLGGVSQFARKFLGGFGLFYIGTLLGLGEGQYAQGYQEHQQYAEQMEASTGRTLGTDQMNYFGPEAAYKNALARAGGGTMAARRRLLGQYFAGSAASDIGGNIMTGFGGYALSLYAAGAAQGVAPALAAGLSTAAPWIGVGAGVTAAVLQQVGYVTEREQTERGIAQHEAATLYSAAEGDPLASYSSYLSKVWKGLGIGVSNLISGRPYGEMETIKMPEAYRKALVRGQIDPNKLVQGAYDARLSGNLGGISREDKIRESAMLLAADPFFDDRFDAAATESVIQTALKAGAYNKRGAEGVLLAQEAGIDITGAAAAMFSLQGGGEMPTSSNVWKTLERMGEMAREQPGVISLVEPGLKLAGRGMWTMRELGKPRVRFNLGQGSPISITSPEENLAGFAGLASSEYAGLAEMGANIAEMQGELGLSSNPLHMDSLRLRETLRGMTDEELRVWGYERKQELTMSSMGLSTRDELSARGMKYENAQAVAQAIAKSPTSQAYNWQQSKGMMGALLERGVDQNAAYGFGMAMSTASPTVMRTYEQAFAGNPLALTQMAISGAPGMNVFATSDIGQDGQSLTGLPLYTSSLWQGTNTPQMTAAKVWGASWAQNDRSGVRGAMVNGIAAPWNPDQMLYGMRAGQVRINELQYEQSMASAGISSRQNELSWAFQTGVGIGNYNPTNPQTGQPFGFNTGKFSWNVPGAGSFTSTGGGFWGLEDAQRAMGYAQQEAGFDFQQRQMEQQRQQFDQNMALSRRQFNLGKGFTQEMWEYQDTTRNLQWQWRNEDFQESARFMTGRDRRLAERQMKRDTIMFGMEGEQIDKQRDHQKDLWRLEEERFNLSKRHFTEGQTLQQEQMQLQRRFFEERKKLEDEAVKLQRAYATEQQKLQKEAIGNQQYYAKLLKDAQDAMTGLKEDQDTVVGQANVTMTLTTQLWDLMVERATEVIEILGAKADTTGYAPPGDRTDPDYGSDDPLIPAYPSDEPRAGYEWYYDPAAGKWVQRKIGSGGGGSAMASAPRTSTTSSAQSASEWQTTILPPGGSKPATQTLKANIFIGGELFESFITKIVEEDLE